MSAAVAVGRPPLPFPPEMLEHLGITAKHLEALGVLDLSLEDAVARGVIRLPPPLTPEQFPQYLRHLQDIHEMGMTMKEWSDPAMSEAVCEGSAEEVLRVLDENPCAS